RTARRHSGKDRWRQHHDAGRPGARGPRVGRRSLGAARPRAGVSVIRVLIVSPSSVSRREIERAVAQDPGLALLAASDSLQSSDGAHAPLDTDGTLTPREREILTLLGEGLVNREIAVRLGISEHTVKTHLAAIYEKLEASNRAEAVATGLRRGLIML